MPCQSGDTLGTASSQVYNCCMSTIKRCVYVILPLALVVLFSFGQQAVESSRLTSDHRSDVATRWFELQLTLILKTPGFSPPVASRALGYSSVALYEAVVGGMPDHNSLVGQLNELDWLPQPDAGRAYNWEAVANGALATITRDLYPGASTENTAAINTLEGSLDAQYRAESGNDVFNRSDAYGKTVAEAVFGWSKSDGACVANSSCSQQTYYPPTGTGMWVPTPPAHQSALLPYWGENRPFVLSSGRACPPVPPVPYSEEPSSPYYAAAMEAYTTVKNLTPEERAIALFWADDAGKTFTPPGHFVSIATQVLRNEDGNLALAAETYARVGIAVADSFIVCWNAKYTYNAMRPITYIKSVIDPTWDSPDVTDPVITPPFPEYTSGHSVQSMAAATVLTALFGDGYHFTDNTDLAWGRPPRSFDSFYAAAEEAAISRLYAGVHYRPAIEAGVTQGQCIGAKVNALDWLRNPYPQLETSTMTLVLKCSTPDSSGNVTFSWSVPAGESAGLLYQWKLTGNDADWSSWESTTRTAYAGLPRGTYQFCVRAMDEKGDVSPDSCCSFTVH